MSKKSSVDVQATAKRKAVVRSETNGAVTAGSDPHRWISEAAYFRAERRGFRPGQEVADWLEAEKEFDAWRTGSAMVKDAVAAPGKRRSTTVRGKALEGSARQRPARR